MRQWFLALACLIASGASASAQSVAEAEAAVLQYVSAVAANDWALAADLMDPEDLARFAELAALLEENEPFTASILNIDSDGPPGELLAAFVSTAVGEDPMMEEALASIQTDVLGTIQEGDSLAHVVSRTQMMLLGIPVRGVETTTVRWDGALWRVRMDSELEAMIIALEAEMENPDLFAPEEARDAAPIRDPKKR